MFGFAHFLLLAFLIPPPAPIQVGPATTYLSGPLHPDGTVNYVAALNAEASKGLKPEDNAAISLVKAAGPTVFDEEVRTETLTALGLADLPEQGLYFLPFPAFETKAGRLEIRQAGDARTKITDPVQEMAMMRAWSATEFPVIAEWLKANEKPMDLVTQAASCQRFYWPAVSVSPPPRLRETHLPRMGPCRQLATAFAARTMLRINSGDAKGAAADTLTILRLGRLLTQNHVLFTHMIGSAIEGMGDEAVVRLLATGKLSNQEARQLLADIDALPARRALSATFRIERLMALDSVAAVCGQGKGGYSDLEIAAQNPWVINAFVDPNIVLRRFNAIYDKIDQAAAKPTFPARAAAMAAVERESADLRIDVRSDFAPPAAWILLAFLPAESRRTVASIVIGNQLVGRFVPMLETVGKVHAKAQMRTDLVRVALALAAYRAEQGQYPDKLGDLSPKYVAKVPDDLFSDQPLAYKRDGEGYVLFSVGPDRKEGGDEKSKLVIWLGKPGAAGK